MSISTSLKVNLKKVKEPRNFILSRRILAVDALRDKIEDVYCLDPIIDFPLMELKEKDVRNLLLNKVSREQKVEYKKIDKEISSIIKAIYAKKAKTSYANWYCDGNYDFHFEETINDEDPEFKVTFGCVVYNTENGYVAGEGGSGFLAVFEEELSQLHDALARKKYLYNNFHGSDIEDEDLIEDLKEENKHVL